MKSSMSKVMSRLNKTYSRAESQLISIIENRKGEVKVYERSSQGFSQSLSQSIECTD